MNEEINEKKPKYSKKIVVLVIVLNVVFTLAILILSYFGDTVPDSLIERWFDFTCKELLVIGDIKGIELIKEGSVEFAKHKYDELSKNDGPNKSDIEE